MLGDRIKQRAHDEDDDDDDDDGMEFAYVDFVTVGVGTFHFIRGFREFDDGDE